MYSYRTVYWPQSDPYQVRFRRAAKQPATWPISDASAATPADWQKADMHIAQAVRHELDREPSVRAAAIDVRVNDGVVTLSGIVDSDGERWLIESAARRIAGVKSVSDQLKVFVAGITPTDDEIAHDCERVLGRLTPAADYAIGVMVSNGWVTLSGYVAEGYERRVAETEISSLLSVHGVNSQVRVRPSVVGNDGGAAMRHRSELKSGGYEFARDDERISWSGMRTAWTTQRTMLASGTKRLAERIRARW